MNWRDLWEWLAAYRIWLVLLLVVVIASIASSGAFINTSNIINILFRATPLAIAAIGETLVIVTGGIDLSVAATWILASVVGGSIAVAGGSVAVAVAGSLAVGAAVGIVNGLIVAFLRIPALITTLGMYTICEAVARIYRGNQPILGMPENYSALGSAYLGPVPFPVIVLAAVLLTVLFIATRTVLGREIYAIGGNASAARYSGLRVNSVLIATYAMAGILAALAGILNSTYLSEAVPNASLTTLFMIIASVVVGGAKLIGGEANVVNTLAGVLIILTIGNVMNILDISPLWEQGVLGVVTLLAVYLNVGLGSAGASGYQRGV